MKPFEKWNYEEVELTFGLKKAPQLATLTHWLEADEPIDAFEEATITRYLNGVRDRILFLNEDEIKFFFISTILNLVNFNKPNVYSAFSQRTISAKVKDLKGTDILLRGRVEWLVALGVQNPRHPFFFLHEYKPQLKHSSDPRGQLLITMLATQTINQQPEQSLYGAYVIGQLWWFVVLENNDYAISEAFDATKSTELLKIFSLLKRCKSYIETAVENQ